MKFMRNNGLSMVLAALFLLFWAGQAWSGWKAYNNDQWIHDRQAIPLSEYLASGHFWQATAENWESEFLQMGFYVILTCFLYQKGSAESKDPEEPVVEDANEKKTRATFLYRNSLAIAFSLLFVIAFAVHAGGALSEENAVRAEHGLDPLKLGDFIMSPEFWFQSFQNWQSEFLAVLSIVTLTIFLRQDGSPESKAMDAPNSKTGK